MISLDNFCKNAILSQYNLPKDSFRTFEEFVDLNNLTDISEEAINFFYNYNINSKVNRYIDTYNEAIHADDVFNEIRSKGGYIYHVTEYNLKTTIEKTGLRPKVGKTIEQGGYRYFPERLYFVKHNKDKDKLKQTLTNIIKDKKLSKYIIVKVKLTNHNISLYKDTAYDEDNNIYTYCAISPKMIEIYDNVNKI